MKCPNCGKEVKVIFTDHKSGYPLDDNRSKICEFCATDKQIEQSKSLEELSKEREQC